MKRSFFLFAFLISVVMGMAQGLPLRFSAQYDNGSYHPFDTVKIENLTRSWTTFLVYPDTTIVLGSSPADGIDVASRSGKSGIKVYPNPFAGKTETVFQMAESGDVIISIIRIDGSVATEYHGHLASGGYRIGVSMSKPQVAFLCIETGGQRHVAKLVNCSDGGSDRIAIIGQVATSTRQTKDTDLDFEPGDMMRYMAVSMLGGHRTESEPMTQELVEGGDIILLFTDGDHPNDGAFDENGASYATFSIAADRQVRFSKGNLQYRASTGIWQFAENQYDYIGNDNANISETYDGWIDLFGWGTSGWNSGAECYQPWSTLGDNYPNAEYTNNLTGAYENADWGIYNPILNGGNQVGMWRTLSYDEWFFLLFGRNSSNIEGVLNARFARANVNFVNGLIIFPDNFSVPNGISIRNLDMVDANFSDNTYTPDQWLMMEYSGAIFLPAAGSRLGSDVNESGNAGMYWSSSYSNEYMAWGVLFDHDYNVCMSESSRYFGQSVRLVKEYLNTGEPSILTIEVSEIGYSNATITSNVINDGGNEISARGVCWSSSHNPTINDSHTIDSGSLGEFNSTLDNLSPSTTYYVRSYATNSVGTAYGTTKVFKTKTPCTTTGGFNENGSSNALFSVGLDKQIHFSKGNLQYQASTNTWRFAENQYDIIGQANRYISDTNNGWIDLFGFGTSGWNSGVNDYQPWSAMSTDFINHDLTDDYANSDWGVYNQISNGGNQVGMWRTLTHDEWYYLLFARATSTVCDTENARFAKATIGSTAGLIVFPDCFSMPSGASSLFNINDRNSSFTNNTLTIQQWVQLEYAGALFLPSAGIRSGTSIYFVGTKGQYWTSTWSTSSISWSTYFQEGNIGLSEGVNYIGVSVRLVQD